MNPSRTLRHSINYKQLIQVLQSQFIKKNKLNVTFYELNYIYRTRWISLEFQAISNLNKVWTLIVKDLEIVRNDRQNFDADVRNKASGLLASIKGIFFYHTQFYIRHFRAFTFF